MDFILVVGCVLAMVPVTLVGRRALDLNPANESRITSVVQALRLLLCVVAITKAIKTSDAWTMGLALPVPQSIGLAILIATGAALAFTMLNLAVRGLGAPALVASAKLATDWLYNKIRNPMVLAVFAWLLSWGLYLQSGAFVLWVLALVIPVEVFFEKHYEEKELEIRFGESYLRYKERTPFMFPQFTFPQSLRKTTVASVLVLGLLLITAGNALATDWKEVPFSNGGAYIDMDVVIDQKNVMVFWFMAKKVANPSEYQSKLTEKKDSWTYQGVPFVICLRKIEVNFGKNPREVRSAFALYFDADGKQIGSQEATQSDWVPESGPGRLWADLTRSTLAKKGTSTGEIPTLLVSK